MIEHERCMARQDGKDHVFKGYPLHKLGTHSIKKASMSILADMCRSMKLVASISGTSVRTVVRSYDVPTFARQKKAVTHGFEAVVQSCHAQPDVALRSPAAAYCTGCGEAASAEWCYCPTCGRSLGR